MMLRAWDGNKFRYDFIITAVGDVWGVSESGMLEKVDWDVTEAIDGIRSKDGNRVFYGDIISDGPYKYAIRNKMYVNRGDQWSGGPDTRTLGLLLPLGIFDIIGNMWQTPEIWKDATWLDQYQK